MTIRCPKCGEEVDHLLVYFEIRQKFIPTEKNEWGYDGTFVGESSSMDIHHDVECPKCSASINNDIDINYYGEFT